jgi:hypothetical protein
MSIKAPLAKIIIKIRKAGVGGLENMQTGVKTISK